MRKRVLILGAGGTVGAAIYRQLAGDESLEVFGTYYSSKQADSPSMTRFSVEFPEDIHALLERVRPEAVVSSLSGDFDKQLSVHEKAADELAKRGGKLIYVSTANVFDGRCEGPHEETDTPEAVSDYGKFKIRCEELLRERLNEQAVLLRLPFVWGVDSPRMQEVRAGCEAGRLEVYSGLRSNHVSDLQIAGLVQWVISEDKTGTFHVGTPDVVSYPDFIQRLIAAMGLRQPELVPREVPAVMAVLSGRRDVPEPLRWDSQRLIQYLSKPYRT